MPLPRKKFDNCSLVKGESVEGPSEKKVPYPGQFVAVNWPFTRDLPILIFEFICNGAASILNNRIRSFLREISFSVSSACTSSGAPPTAAISAKSLRESFAILRAIQRESSKLPTNCSPYSKVR